MADAMGDVTPLTYKPMLNVLPPLATFATTDPLVTAFMPSAITENEEYAV